MRTLILPLLLLACSTPKPSPEAPQATSAKERCGLALEPLARDARCLDLAEECLSEAKTAKLFDPLDSFTREQEELIVTRGCLLKLRECRSAAWRP